ncbi:MAG: glutathione S-transferase C-terminal domain-containing protein, partial [Pseudomonadota bacterium]
MGQLVDGVWHDTWYDTKSTGGAFKRSTAGYRNWITADGSAGSSGKGGFRAESGRYHLYVSLACPWAHRTLIFRALKGLAEHIGVSVVHPDMMTDGWSFAADYEGATGDRLYGLPFARDVYLKADPNTSGRVTVPILWDQERETIVSNESSEIIRMLNSAFDGITGNTDDYWPSEMRDEIEPVNERIYSTLNNGVYKAGFATSQEAYGAGVVPLFDTLDWLEARLATSRYLMGDRITEADWRLFTTLIRFDLVYHLHFK